MDGKAGQIMDIAMPVGAAVMSTYGPTYAAGARTGAALWDRNREIYKEKKTGARMADLLDASEQANMGAQTLMNRNLADYDIEQGLAQVGQDGQIYDVRPGPWAPGQQPMGQPSDKYKTTVDPAIARARELYKAGRINEANELMNGVRERTYEYRTTAIKLAADKTARDVDYQRDLKIGEIDHQNDVELQKAADEAAMERIKLNVGSNILLSSADLQFRKTAHADQMNVARREIALAEARGETSEALNRASLELDVLKEDGDQLAMQTEAALSLSEQYQNGTLDAYERDEQGNKIPDGKGGYRRVPQYEAALRFLDEANDRFATIEARRLGVLKVVSPGVFENDPDKPIVVDAPEDGKDRPTVNPNINAKTSPAAGTVASRDAGRMADYGDELGKQADEILLRAWGDVRPGQAPDLDVGVTALVQEGIPMPTAQTIVHERLADLVDRVDSTGRATADTYDRMIEIQGNLKVMKNAGLPPEQIAANLVKMGLPPEVALKVATSESGVAMMDRIAMDKLNEAELERIGDVGRFVGDAAMLPAQMLGDATISVGKGTRALLNPYGS